MVFCQNRFYEVFDFFRFHLFVLRLIQKRGDIRPLSLALNLCKYTT